MNEKIVVIFLVVMILTTSSIHTAIVEAPSEIVLKPFRAVVVIDIDWGSDPESYVESTYWAFHDVVTLLKLWSIPFDILRLDNNVLNITQFVDAEGKPKYGVIIWNCRQDRFDPSQPEYVGGTRDWSILETAVTMYGISLITLANTILEPRIRELLGINYLDLSNSICWYQMPDPFVVTRDHFITRGYNGTAIPAGDYGQEGTMGGYGSRVGFDTTKATVLGSQGSWPQLAVRDLTESTKAVWIGGNRDEVLHLSPIMAEILRRAITYCIGYSLYKTYPNTVLLRMDDPGSAESAYDPAWHYSQLTKEQIESSIIQPLLEHNATLAVMYLTGYPRDTERSVLKSWTLDWVDPYGTRQNLTSNYLGILEGISEGVLEIQSHGWTHMQPDLDSAPGPWWDNPSGTEWSNIGWYREFYDTRRNKEIDVATQELHLDYSIQYTQEAFSTFPLSFAPGGDAISGMPSSSNVPETYTYKLAALKGFGLASGGNGYYYLGPLGDIVISNMRMTRTYYLNQVSDIRTRLKAYGEWDIPVIAYFHDRDIALNPNYLHTYLDQLGAPATSTENAVQDYMSNNEFVGYMHAKPSALSSSLGFTFEYDSHYCKYFATNNSTWTLHLSDAMLAKFRDLGKIDITVDGAYHSTVNAYTYFNETQNLIIPQGVGTHTIQFTKNRDIAIINVAPSTTTAVAGTTVNINVTVRNEGSMKETFNVTTYYDNNKIGTQTVTDLSPEATTILTFNWNTSTLPLGNYTIKAEASTVPSEIDTADNIYINGIIRIVKPPIASFTYFPANPKPGDLVLFNASLSTPNGGTIVTYEWNFGDGNVTSTTNPTITHAYAMPGTYNVTLTLIDSEGLDASAWNSVTISAHIETKISISTYASSSFVGFKVDINGTLTDLEENGISHATVVLSYTFPGISEWVPFTSAKTDLEGNYYSIWIPQGTGYFTLKAEWAGNETHLGANKNTTLNVIPYEDTYIFSVASNSTISTITFNLTSLELSFNATGPSGTTGFVRATIAKTLAANITNLKVYLDESPLEYSTSSTDDSWVVYFTYAHSTHRIIIALSPMVERASATFPTIYMLLPSTIVMLILATSIKRKIRPRNATHA